MALLVFFLSALFFVLLYNVFRPAVSPLRHLPGPFWARFTRFWLLSKVWDGRMHLLNIKLHQQHGPIVRIAPNEYSIDDPESVQLIYGARGAFPKSPFYSSVGIPGDAHVNLFSDPNIERHAVNRRKIMPAYSMSNLVQLEPFIDDCTALYRKRLDEFIAAGTWVDIPYWMKCYAFDVIGAITVGERFGFLDSGTDIGGIMASLKSSLFYAARVGIFPELHHILFYLNAIVAPSVKGMFYTQNYIGNQVDAFMSSKAKPGAQDNATGAVPFLTRFRILHEENNEKMRKKDMIETCFLNIGAGSDTTALGFSSVLFHLLKNPGVFHRLRKEVDESHARGEFGETITFKQAQALPYLQAVIKEALRVHPVTGLPLGRVVPKGGAVIAGQRFPAGTIVGINAWVAHANKDIFGGDAEFFNPDRWLEDPEVVKRRDSYMLSFGTGTRTCLGKNISLLELSKLVPILVRNYDFELEHPDQSMQTENDWFVLIEDFRCRIRHRVDLSEKV